MSIATGGSVVYGTLERPVAVTAYARYINATAAQSHSTRLAALNKLHPEPANYDINVDLRLGRIGLLRDRVRVGVASQ
jgi:hypothetical protein